MGYDAPDVYYKPEHFGLTLVGAAEKEPNHDFDIFAVWRDQEGALYYGQDAGCSCPSPFEDFTSLDGLTKAESVQQIHTALDDWAESQCDVVTGVNELHAKLADLSVNLQQRS